MTVYPLFGKLEGSPYRLDFSANNPRVKSYATQDFESFQAQVFAELHAAGATWAIGVYGEDRRALLRDFDQMISEGRVFHAGLDIVVSIAEPLYAPVPSIVQATGFDAGVGNYGGYVILHHPDCEAAPYSFYGHLERPFMVEAGQQLNAGDSFARTGAGEDSGQWFSHTHLQLITQRAMDEGRTTQGYVDAVDLAQIDSLFPDPSALFRADFAQR